MMSGQPAFRVKIEPRGAAILRAADGTHPEGYQTAGRFWAVQLPSEVLTGGMTYDLSREQFICADEDNAAGGLVRLRGFWLAARGALLPDLTSCPPRSRAGLVSRRILKPLTREIDRAAQIEGYRLAAQDGAVATTVSDDIALMLRQLQILTVPSRSEVRIWCAAPGRWILQMAETGNLERLLDTAFALPVDKKDVHPIVIGSKLAGAESTNLAPRFVALVRAVQLARLWAACWRERPRLDIEVIHSGLNGQAVRLTVEPESWGLPLARLAHLLAEVLSEDEPEPIWTQIGDCGLAPQLGQPTSLGDFAWHDHAVLQPVSWQISDAQALPRWTYAGAGHAGVLAELPFALSPESPFPPDQRRAFLEWLGSERRLQGLQPEFALTYLQGLEHRLLADVAPMDERTKLVSEIGALASLVDAPLRAQLCHLLDWLGATGRRGVEGLNDEGPLTVLVTTATKLADDHALSQEDLWTLATVCLGAEISGSQSFRAGIRELAPDGLRFILPKVELVASYEALSGGLDELHRKFLHKGQPLADLRASARLQHVFARAQAIADSRSGQGMMT